MTQAGDCAVSVVIPCYRCAGTIERAIESIYRQTIPPHEVILVDDCSADATVEVLYKVQAKYSPGWIKVIELYTNGGPSVARNAGWNAASQPYIAFLDADDSWHPQKLGIQYSWMLSRPEVVLTGHICKQLTRNSLEMNTECDQKINQTVTFQKVSLNQLLVSNRFSTPSVIIKKTGAQRFNTDFRRCEDFLLWCEVVANGGLVYTIDVPLAFTHKKLFGEAGLSGDLRAMEADELRAYNKLKHLKVLSPFKWFLLSCWSLLKYCRRLAITTPKRYSE